MSVEVEEVTPRPALDNVLQQHLRLDPHQVKKYDISERSERKRSISQPPLKFGLQKTQVNRSTIESDNKKRPAILKRSASKYEPPPPDPVDPNSAAKSVAIRRMQKSLEDWDKQFEQILQKKVKNDRIYKTQLEQQDSKIEELKEKYSSELHLRIITEKERDQLSKELNTTQEELSQTRAEAVELQTELGQYQGAYQESEIKKAEWENEAKFTAEQLEKSEGMRRRLNDQVTELQGQLAIEEQRSRFCVIV